MTINWAKLALTVGPWVITAILAGLLYVSHGNNAALSAKVQAETDRADMATTTLSSYVDALKGRDSIIKAQSASIEAMKATADANRAAYEKALADARLTADGYRGRAEELLKLQAPEGELAQCRAARDLLEKELTE